MSDERGDLTPEQLDELASAYLDGEATAEEAALVESDPRLQELVEELRAIRNLVGAPVEGPSDEVRDQMIARALDHRAPVASMETARRRLRAIPPQARVILAAAAVVAAIALVGVTVFNQASRDSSDQFADDSAPAAVMADEAPMDAPAEASAPESAESVEEPLAGSAAPDSADADTADAPSDAPAEEMMEDDMAVELVEAPMDDGGYAEEEPETVEAPAEESDDGEVAMADEAADAAPTSGEEFLVFETASDLADYMMLLAEDLVDAQGTSRLDESTAIDLMGCPLFPDEGIELLSRFDAVVDQVEVQVSVYLSDDDLQLTETSPPPDCELLNSHTFLNWLE